jgi:hypothetical protein
MNLSGSVSALRVSAAGNAGDFDLLEGACECLFRQEPPRDRWSQPHEVALGWNQSKDLQLLEFRRYFETTSRLRNTMVLSKHAMRKSELFYERRAPSQEVDVSKSAPVNI